MVASTVASSSVQGVDIFLYYQISVCDQEYHALAEYLQASVVTQLVQQPMTTEIKRY